jgi:hypothetical protein
MLTLLNYNWIHEFLKYLKNGIMGRPSPFTGFLSSFSCSRGCSAACFEKEEWEEVIVTK